MATTHSIAQILVTIFFFIDAVQKMMDKDTQNRIISLKMHEIETGLHNRNLFRNVSIIWVFQSYGVTLIFIWGSLEFATAVCFLFYKENK